MRRCPCLGMGLTVCMLLPPAALAAQPVTSDYSFDRPIISEITIAGQPYHRVTMPGCPNGGNTGEPALPATGARILLPFGTDVTRVTVVPAAQVPLGRDYLIEPTTRPVRLLSDRAAAEPPTPDPAIYASDQAFPGETFERIGTYSFRGYRILTLKLHPVQYVPATGELYYYPRLTVVVDTYETGRADPLFRGLAHDQTEVLSRIDNPEVAHTYTAGGRRTDRSFELLILTTDGMASAFQPLKDYHDADGMPTEIHTTSDVGSTDPDDVRSYIAGRYLMDGVSYVIIGGDDDIIPAKDLYVEAWAGGDVESAMPGDIYFACLDGTWNYDGDSRWGEPNDGEGGGDVDLVAEVYVGRASVDNTTEATRFVDKTLFYLNNQHSTIENVLMVGEYLGFGGVADYGAWSLEELIDGSSANGYTTIGIPSSIYTIDELFERDWPGNSWPQSELVSRINNGIHVLNHLGHGNTNYAMKLYNSDITSLLTNDDLCFVYSQTCLAGHFDGTDCWAEYMNIKTDSGAFAVIMNARSGWGQYNSTDGPSQRFNREFWDAVFSPAEAKLEFGRANQDSKEDNLYRVNQECMRWCYYELNLFGDPTVAVKGLTGLRVTPVDDFVSEGLGGGPFIPGSMDYTLENAGDAGIDYEVTKTKPWVTITNGSGYIAPGGTVTVTVSINAEANSLPDGSYHDTLSFVNTTDHAGDTTRDVTLNVGIPQVVYEWTLDSNPGWTTEGQWAWGQPTGGGGAYGGPDPTSGHTGVNVYGYNLNGDYTNNMSELHLTSAPIDCTGLGNVTLSFWRWLGVEQPAFDHAYVRVSSDGTSWTTVWQNGAEITDYSWVLQEVDVSDVADNQPTVYLRWTMGSTDGGWTYCGWNIDDIQLIALGGEEPPLSILFPEGLPEYLDPGVPTPVTVQIVDGSETYVPDSGLLHYRYDGGAFLTAPLTNISGNLYQATLPAAGCSAAPEYYFSADGDGGSTVINPPDAPGSVFTAIVGTLATVMQDAFETDQGWTVGDVGDDATTGIWDRGDPVGTEAQPEYDHTPAPGVMCYATDCRGGSLGDYDVDGGKTTLKSPVLDLSAYAQVMISYYRWYSNNTGADPNNDVFTVDISNDGGSNWTNVEIVGPSGAGTSGGWMYHEFNVADFVTPTSQVMLRFVAADEGSGSLVEAALDDFLAEGFACEEPYAKGDLNCDGAIDGFDIDPFVLALTAPEEYPDQYPDCNLMLADINEDGAVNGFDVDPFVELLTGQ